tara:strand:- start:2302 stop:3258 length:957 start_codon:yes stop_codon:yes gene_type:complete
MIKTTNVRNILRPIADFIDPGRKLRRYIIEKNAMRKYSGINVESAEYGNKKIYAYLENGTSFCAGKFGATESKTYMSCMEGELKKVGVSKSIRDEIYLHSGVYPVSDANLQRFSNLYEACAEATDLLGVWFQPGEVEIIKNSGAINRNLFFDFTGLEPYYHNSPWSKGLVGKKVLVVSPFSESIMRQYEKRSLIWPSGVLPDFELKTLNFPHSKALVDNEFESWFEMYDSFCEKMETMDFDIAITGAGAATLPLAAYAKKMGKQGIGMGGSLQILFGIVGRRWEKHPFFQGVINNQWVRPSGLEIPKSKNKIENSAYW